VSTEDLGGEAIDLLMGIREKESNRMDEVREKDQSQLQVWDTTEMLLYKMFEQVKHVNFALGHLNRREEELHTLLRANEELPTIIAGFDKIPK